MNRQNQKKNRPDDDRGYSEGYVITKVHGALSIKRVKIFVNKYCKSVFPIYYKGKIRSFLFFDFGLDTRNRI